MLFAILGLVLLSGLLALVLYNTLIKKRNEVENAFSGIEVQLTKRYDLIPNLVEAVKQYMQHEKSLLENITKLRVSAMNPETASDMKLKLDNQISSGLGKIMVAVENYPDLKSNSTFIELQKSLNEVEEQLSAARRTFNAMVTDYNNSIEMFPSSIMASFMGLRRRELFIAPEEAKKRVDLKKMF